MPHGGNAGAFEDNKFFLKIPTYQFKLKLIYPTVEARLSLSYGDY